MVVSAATVSRANRPPSSSLPKTDRADGFACGSGRPLGGECSFVGGEIEASSAIMMSLAVPPVTATPLAGSTRRRTA